MSAEYQTKPPHEAVVTAENGMVVVRRYETDAPHDAKPIQVERYPKQAALELATGLLCCAMSLGE